MALARALARDPRVLLLDEPLSALDSHTRQVVRGELQELLASLDRPTLLVTHDFEDAAALAARVGVIVRGRVRQLGTPAELIAQPADAFVAAFTGANLLAGVARRDGAGSVVLLDQGTEIRSTGTFEGRVAVAVHPWEVEGALRAAGWRGQRRRRARSSRSRRRAAGRGCASAGPGGVGDGGGAGAGDAGVRGLRARARPTAAARPGAHPRGLDVTRRGAVVLVVAALALAGCGRTARDGGGETVPLPTTTPVASTIGASVADSAPASAAETPEPATGAEPTEPSASVSDEEDTGSADRLADIASASIEQEGGTLTVHVKLARPLDVDALGADEQIAVGAYLLASPRTSTRSPRAC